MSVRLDSKKVKAAKIRQAMHQVLKEKIYLENVLKYSKISRQTNGIKTTGEIIINYIINDQI